MYDRAETAQANDRLWSAVRNALGYGPETLTRDMDVWDIWQSPDLLLAQTCGYPYRAHLHNHVELVGTPDYGVDGCPPGYYNSVFIARRDDTRKFLTDFSETIFAYNEPMSQSGWAAPVHHVTTLGMKFGEAKKSGAHVMSARLVAEGQADIAAIDAVTWALIEKYDKFSRDLHIVERTEPTPGLPYISALGSDKSALFAAMDVAIRSLANTDRQTLQIKGIVDIPVVKYLKISTPAAPTS